MNNTFRDLLRKNQSNFEPLNTTREQDDYRTQPKIESKSKPTLKLLRSTGVLPTIKRSVERNVVPHYLNEQVSQELRKFQRKKLISQKSKNILNQPLINLLKKNKQQYFSGRQEQNSFNLTFGISFDVKRPTRVKSHAECQGTSRVLSGSQRRLVNKIFS
ncbi:hypothetical protein pb186bvf_019408 [Paramecium bursaria]